MIINAILIYVVVLALYLALVAAIAPMVARFRSKAAMMTFRQTMTRVGLCLTIPLIIGCVTLAFLAAVVVISAIFYAYLMAGILYGTWVYITTGEIDVKLPKGLR